ncbi:MAG TPA: hypothetical protein VLI92_01565 [Candidatus Saccharimonadales bacterium]|nr:hypothetical protein [Candidatus Saccharimonadales bacterium]
MEELLQQEAAKIASQYKISQDEALKKLQEIAQKDLKLQKKLGSVQIPQQIPRLSEYKDFIKKAKKDIYYSLRKFHADEETEAKLLAELQNGAAPQILTELAKTHASTKERAEFVTQFSQQLSEIAKDATSIIDIGGGLFPLQFDFANYPKLQKYLWIDKDQKAYKILEALNNPKLHLYNELIGTHPWTYYGESFDLALMIKLVPLMYRQNR